MNPVDYLREAYRIAANLSEDPVTHNGALIVSSNGVIIGRGANRLPSGVLARDERFQRPLKCEYLIHAELDAILDAAKRGAQLSGATMFCPWAPCTSCAIAIIQSGIKCLVAHKQIHDKTPERWRESITMAVDMLSEAGVHYEQFDGQIGDVKHMFDGVTWMP